MLLRNLNEEECRELLIRLAFGRLGCAFKNQPYVVPIYFVYQAECLYGFSTAGQKIEWMRANPLVCVEVDEVLAQESWSSVIVYGQYQELPDSPKYAELRRFAHELVEKRSLWWELAIASSQARREEMRPVPILYRIQINKMNGRKAVAD